MHLKHLLALCMGIAIMGIAPAAEASPAPKDDSLIGLTTPNGKLVYDFINLWFNERKPAEAFDKYVSRTRYMNHAVYSASTGKHPSK